MQKINKVRAVNNEGNEVGQTRRKLYTGILGQIKNAEVGGFYLEAITLYESLITDRLESVLSLVSEEEISFKNLGSLIGLVRHYLPDSELDKIVFGRLEPWRLNRNESLHGMAKLEKGQDKEFMDEYQKCKDYCVEGKEIFRIIDKVSVKIKAKKGK